MSLLEFELAYNKNKNEDEKNSSDSFFKEVRVE